MFTHIKNIIEETNISKTIKEGITFSYWYEEVEKELPNVTKVYKIDNKILYINVANSTYLHYLTLKKQEIINKINKVSADKIIDIKFRIGKVD